MPPEVAGQIDAELAARAETSLRIFIRQAWHVMEPTTPFVAGWHLDAIAEHLEAVTQGQIQNLLVNLPPRHCKSLSVCVFWPVWEWIRYPSRRWLFSAYALSLSVRDSLKCRRLIESPWFQHRWRDRFQIRNDQRTKDRFENDHSGHRIATSVGGAATGEGGDRVIVDDPHRINQRDSTTVREAALVWWDQTMSTRLNDPRNGARVIVMQRLHEADLSGHVLKQGGYVHLLLPAEFESDRKCVTSIGWQDPRSNEAELLWPQRVGPAQIADAKLRLGPDGYCGQFQQRPTAAGGGRFQSKWFRYYRTVPSANPLSVAYELFAGEGKTRRVEDDNCRRFAVMDPAGAEKEGGNRPCYTVIQVWVVTPESDLVLRHQFREQVQTPRAAEAALQICSEFSVEYIAVEKDGLGLGVVQELKRKGATVRAIKAKGDKSARSQTAEIRMSNGQIYFPREAPFLFELEQELLLFPRGQYADQVDALAYAAMEVARAGGAVAPDERAT